MGSGFWNGGSNAYGAYAAVIYSDRLVCGGIFSSAGGNGAGNVAQWDGLTLTGISKNSSTPRSFRLFQNYPNPFNPSTVISFDLPIESNVSLNIFDIGGKLVSNVVNEKLKSGKHEFSFNAQNLSSGTYFYRIETESFTETKTMTLIK